MLLYVYDPRHKTPREKSKPYGDADIPAPATIIMMTISRGYRAFSTASPALKRSIRAETPRQGCYNAPCSEDLLLAVDGIADKNDDLSPEIFSLAQVRLASRPAFPQQFLASSCSQHRTIGLQKNLADIKPSVCRVHLEPTVVSPAIRSPLDIGCDFDRFSMPTCSTYHATNRPHARSY